MYIELIDLLRCPKDHEETWLVAAFTTIEDRFVIEAKLGCPVCGASYVITNGIADLRQQRVKRTLSSPKEDHPEAAIRVAALLDLTVPSSLAVLEGTYSSTAARVSEMTQCRVLALNPAQDIEESETVGVILSDARIPLASNSVHALAIEQATLLTDAPRVLRQGARITTPTTNELPAGVVELARDDHDILGAAVEAIISLRRGQGKQG